MVKAAEGDHPYWYARVLGIFHVDVVHAPSKNYQSKTIQLLWVRWLGDDAGQAGSFADAALHRVGYVPDGEGAFGFLDPATVIRGCNLVPTFRFGYTKQLLPQSMYWDDEDLGDYVNYYVNL